MAVCAAFCIFLMCNKSCWGLRYALPLFKNKLNACSVQPRRHHGALFEPTGRLRVREISLKAAGKSQCKWFGRTARSLSNIRLSLSQQRTVVIHFGVTQFHIP